MALKILWRWQGAVKHLRLIWIYWKTKIKRAVGRNCIGGNINPIDEVGGSLNNIIAAHRAGQLLN